MNQGRPLRLLSYNIWFAEYMEIERALALLITIKEQDPDVICLQEVKGNIYAMLKDNLRHDYTHFFPKYVAGRYGCVIFSKHPITDGYVHKYIYTKMNRHLVMAKVEYEVPVGLERGENGHRLLVKCIPIIVANTHYESEFNEYNKCKLKQYEISQKILNNLHAKFKNVVLCGDMNLKPEEEKDFFDTDIWTDAWVSKGSDDDKYSFDSERNPYLRLKTRNKYKSRLDRILCRGDNYSVKTYRLILPDEGTVPPSDHFGIYTTLALRNI